MPPKVNSPRLASVLETAGPKIDSFTTTLDAISEDIRMMEQWILKSGIRFEMKVLCNTGGPFLIDAEDATDVWLSHSGLSWSCADDGKTWRIHFEENLASKDNNMPTLRRRPLIETPVPVRLQIETALANLIKEIADCIPSERVYGASPSLVELES
jgi:hypothetical protein